MTEFQFLYTNFIYLHVHHHVLLLLLLFLLLFHRLINAARVNIFQCETTKCYDRLVFFYGTALTWCSFEFGSSQVKWSELPIFNLKYWNMPRINQATRWRKVSDSSLITTRNFYFTFFFFFFFWFRTGILIYEIDRKWTASLTFVFIVVDLSALWWMQLDSSSCFIFTAVWCFNSIPIFVSICLQWRPIGV